MNCTDMALGRGSALLYITLSVLVIASFSTHTNAEEYTVGDSDQWTLNVDYSAWAAKYKFVVGDSLRFKYVSAAHDVYQVSKADYENCVSTKAIKEYDQTGDTVVELTEATTYYFLCSIPTHCEFGMKVAVNVTAASGGAPQAPASTPPTQAPSSTPSKTQAPKSTPAATPPTNKSSATSLLIASPPQLALLFSSSLVVLFLTVFL